MDDADEIVDRARRADDLRRDLGLHNDVLFSLLVICQTTIDTAGELVARRGLRFRDDTEAIRELEPVERFARIAARFEEEASGDGAGDAP